MSDIAFSETYFSLIPPVVTILLALLTRKIILSLIAGIILGSLLINNFNIPETFFFIINSIKDVFAINKTELQDMQKILIIFFLLLLGSIYTLIHASGGTISFGRWLSTKINNGKKTQLFVLIAGFAVFIDDYLNALIVGNTCRSLTDKHKVSRAKLAYILDSTSAPVCIIAPLSSWGAYIISLLSISMMTHGINFITPFIAYIYMIPLNFYALYALVMVFLVICFKLDILWMAKHEYQAKKNNILYDTKKGIPAGIKNTNTNYKSTSASLLIPVSILTIFTMIFMVLTGIHNMDEEYASFSIIKALEYTNVGLSLLIGAIAGYITIFIICLKIDISLKKIGKITLHGFLTMKTAILILLCAWILSEVIEQIGTGNYISHLTHSIVNPDFLPAIIFLISLTIAFTTGSSWGAFSLLIPIITGLICKIHDQSIFIPAMSAMAAGAVFGDHCSPISDTTVLSSIGAGSHHMDHVITQLPYSILAGIIAFSGYLIMGYSKSIFYSVIATLITFIVVLGCMFILKNKTKFKVP